MKKTFNKNRIMLAMFMLMVVVLPLGSLLGTQHVSNQKSAVELRQKYSEYSWAKREDDNTLNDIKAYIVSTAGKWADEAKKVIDAFSNNPISYIEKNIK